MSNSCPRADDCTYIGLRCDRCENLSEFENYVLAMLQKGYVKLNSVPLGMFYYNNETGRHCFLDEEGKAYASKGDDWLEPLDTAPKWVLKLKTVFGL